MIIQNLYTKMNVVYQFKKIISFTFHKKPVLINDVIKKQQQSCANSFIDMETTVEITIYK